MMNRALWRKAITESQVLWLSCAALLYAFCWIRVWITSQLDMSQFENILANLPEAWQRLSPVPIEQLASYPARIAITFEEPLVYLAIALWTVARSSDCVSGEIGRGTMEMLLAQPISRWQVLLTPTCVTLLGTALLALVAVSGTLTGIATTSVEMSVHEHSLTIPWTGIEIPSPSATEKTWRVPMSQLVDAHLFWPAALNLFALGFLLAGVATFLSSCDRYRGRTIGILVAFYVVQMIVEVVALAVEQCSWLKWLTFFSAYEPVAIVSRSVGNPGYAWSWIARDQIGQSTMLGPLGYDAILIGLGLLGFIAAIVVFVRRDLPAPL